MVDFKFKLPVCPISLHNVDLELAAEIGKNLLERNKELEVMLKSSHQYQEEQSVKNEVCRVQN